METNGKYAPRPGNIPGVPLNIGGIDFVLAPLGMRLAREIEAKGLKFRESDPSAEDAHRFNLEIILLSLNRNYPDITAEELDALLDTAVEAEAVSAVLLQTGLKRVTPGELKPRG